MVATSDVATIFAEQGYLVLVPNYRLAPADEYPAAREDGYLDDALRVTLVFVAARLAG